MGKNPLVSVIINVHNGEKFICKALDSVLSQHYDHLEILIWDNASTDSTVELIRPYAKDSRVVIIESKHKTDLFHARNAAFRESSGDLIAFLDSDDFWMPDKISIAVTSLSKDDADVFYSNFKILEQDNDKTKVAYGNPLASGDVLRQLATNYPVCFSTLVFSRRALQKFEGPFNPKFKIIGDFDLVLRLGRSFKFSAHNNPLTVYRVHKNNLGSRSQIDRSGDLQVWLNENLQALTEGQTFAKRALVSLLVDNLASKVTLRRKHILQISKLLGFSFLVGVLSEKIRWTFTNRFRLLVYKN